MSPDGSRPRVVVLVGLPGSGKSTWARQQGAAVISSDDMRFLLSDDASNQTIHGLVFGSVRYFLRKRLELGRPVTYIDATNLTRHERRGYIKTAQMYDARPEAVFFDTPVQLCRQRNRLRDRVVPEHAMDLLASRLTPPTLDEGFETITVYTGLSA